MESIHSLYMTLIGILIFMGILMWVGYKLTTSKVKFPLSPYTQTPLRRLDSLHFITLAKVMQYLVTMEDFDNRVFKIKRASYCRETGRIFPDSVNWIGKIHVDWTFLQQRMPGTWVSWGSLPHDRRQELMDKHGSLQGFQTEFSSEHPRPQDFEPEYNEIKPGPLYVNLENDWVMGWKVIPDTELETLVVKKPIIYI